MKQQCECQRKANINEKDKDIMLGLIKIREKIKELRAKEKEIEKSLAELRLAEENASDQLSKSIKGMYRKRLHMSSLYSFTYLYKS